jgi:hypothetical protein
MYVDIYPHPSIGRYTRPHSLPSRHSSGAFGTCRGAVRDARLIVCATPLCWHSRGTAGTGAIYNSSVDGNVCFALMPSVGRRRGRRRNLGTRDRGCAVGWPIWAHVGGRRRRRHLRHRRLRRQHRLLPGRVGEHRRRCAGRARAGVGGGYCVEYYSRVLRGTKGYNGTVYVRGSQWYSRSARGVPRGHLGVLKGYSTGTAGAPKVYQRMLGLLAGYSGVAVLGWYLPDIQGNQKVL